MKKDEIISVLSINHVNFSDFVTLLKKGLEEATAGGHEWPHRWPCEGGRLIACEWIHWDPFYEQVMGDKPQIQFEENKKGDIIVSLTFSFNVALENEHIPIPGKKFTVMRCGPKGSLEGDWYTQGHWETKKIPTNLVTVIFRNIEDNYVLGTMFPGPFKDPGDYSGFDPDRITEVSIDEIIRRKINFRISENVTNSSLIDAFVKNIKLVDPNGVEHKLIPVTQE